MVLAIGRTNPLKNFGADRPRPTGCWPEPRPGLKLFGVEPELGARHGAEYEVRPSDADVNELLNEATVFVQTSRHEGFALPPLEAMATGGAVVCTDAHGNRDFCRDGENCLMPAARPRAVRDAIQRLLDDPGLRSRLGEAGSPPRLATGGRRGSTSSSASTPRSPATSGARRSPGPFPIADEDRPAVRLAVRANVRGPVKRPGYRADGMSMHVSSKVLPALAVTAALVCPATAGADMVTLGSDLSAPANMIEAQGADTAFWPITVAGQAIAVPADGQIVSVTVKGSVIQEPGAQKPATLFHVQSLGPAAADGSRTVYLTSQGFDMPVTQMDPTGLAAGPTPVTTFKPENLCVHGGGSVDLNEIGGFQYGGSLTAPLDPTHYLSGTPYQMFSSVSNSTTARFTADNQTNNGQTLSPQTANQTPGKPVGKTTAGEELLMRVLVATGNDRSQSCGGPPRTPDGQVIPPKPPLPTAMHVKAQSLYVSKTRSVAPSAFCPAGVSACTGTSTLTYKGKKIAATTFRTPKSKTAHIAMKVTKAFYNLVAKRGKRPVPVTWTLVTPQGTYVQALTLHR